MNPYEHLATAIIDSQTMIIGPVAVEQANQVSGLTVDWNSHSVSIASANPTQIIDELVEQYRQLFGQISVEVCKEAAHKVASELPHDQLPSSLK